ncbi:MAG TPA: hypothetical protein VFI14_03045, partial [Chryseosolibacter sp.]|nr:hypothetical protein [Chryseosolibacter sp.]
MLLSHNIRTSAFVALLLALSHVSMGQLRLLGTQGNIPEKARNAAGNQARTKQSAPLTLPFFDDFSKPVNHLYADTSR